VSATDRSSGGHLSPRRVGRPAPRLLFPTDRADLIVTWHDDEDRFVLSLWHDDVCVGTAPLGARDAAEVASFLVTQLGERGRWTPHVVDPEQPVPGSRSRPLMQRLLERVRRHL
jgi:hypothetical protein